MTSEQTEVLQRLLNAASDYITACDEFDHAFGQDYPQLAEIAEFSGGSVASDMAELDEEIKNA